MKIGDGFGTREELLIETAELRTVIDHLMYDIKDAINALGAPTMNYEPTIAIKEYDKKIKRATDILLKALKEASTIYG